MSKARNNLARADAWRNHWNAPDPLGGRQPARRGTNQTVNSSNVVQFPGSYKGQPPQASHNRLLRDLAKAFRLGGRLVPWLNIALTISDIFQLARSFSMATAGGLTYGAGWYEYMNCTDDIGGLNAAAINASCGAQSLLLTNQWNNGIGQYNTWHPDGYPTVASFPAASPEPAAYPGYPDYWTFWPGKILVYEEAIPSPPSHWPRIEPDAPGVQRPEYPFTEKSPLPTIAPELYPPLVPVPQPEPLPWAQIPKRVTRVDRVPGHRWEAGNEVENPNSVPGQSPTKPYATPQQAPSVVVDSVGVTIIPPTSHFYARPPRGTKEGKMKASPAAAAILGAISTFTEALDLIDVLYQSLPKSAKVKYKGTPYELRTPTPDQKLKAIYNGFDQIDPSKAVSNYVANQIEDMIYGKIGKASSRASQALRIHGDARIGIQAGARFSNRIQF